LARSATKRVDRTIADLALRRTADMDQDEQNEKPRQHDDFEEQAERIDLPAMQREADGESDGANAFDTEPSPATTAGGDLAARESEVEPQLFDDGESVVDSAKQDGESRVAEPTESPGEISTIDLSAGMSIPPGRPTEFAPSGTYELPLEPIAGEDASTSAVDQLFPSHLRAPAGSAGHSGASPIRSKSPAGADAGDVLPRLQVMVTLAEARALFEEVLETASQRTAPKFLEVVKREIEMAAWRAENQRRAADWRLRGPG
jgi:hypothetical protein